MDYHHVCVLGECKLIDEIMVGEDKLIRFSGDGDEEGT